MSNNSEETETVNEELRRVEGQRDYWQDCYDRRLGEVFSEHVAKALAVIVAERDRDRAALARTQRELRKLKALLQFPTKQRARK